MKLIFFVLSSILSLNSLSAEIVVGVGLAKPPFIMEDEKSGAEYEIINRAFNLAGYSPKISFLPQTRMINQFKSKTIDAMISIKALPGGEGYLSEYYIAYQNVAISQKSTHVKIKTIADLGKYQVSSFQNSKNVLGEEYANAITKSRQYKEFPRQIIQVKMLIGKRTEVIVMEKNIFAYLAKKNGAKLEDFEEHFIFPVNHYRVAFHSEKLRDHFNNGLALLKKSGEHQKILNKYNVKN